MATLVLTAVGAVVGGPVGAAIGAIAGQQIDQRLFAPKPRQGPRLGDLAVQTSNYGSAIPKLFGTMRVAGTVIWATDLSEDRSTSGGGKGRPKTINYSYSASFAVALSGRPIRAVRRIWADGNLLRGAAGDFKTATKYRLYLGGEDQQIDPAIAAIAAIEGAGAAPAYRGTAYAVFEDFQLAAYGNRIPSLSFEVEADPGSVAIGAIAAMLSDGAVADGVTPAVAGYAAGGESVRGAVEALGDVVPLSVSDAGATLRVTNAIGPTIPIAAAEAGAVRERAQSGGRSEVSRRAAGAIPGEVSITYYEPARDYQTGLQRARRGEPSPRHDRRALPAALDAGTAKAFAEQLLATLWAGRASASIHLGCRRATIRPGAHLTIPGEAGVWRVVRCTIERMVVSFELRRIAGGTAPAAASPGRPVAQPDLIHGATTLRLLDLPLYGELDGSRPQLLVAAAGAATGWRGADLTASYDGGASWESAGTTAAPAVIGTVLTILPPRGAALFDHVGFCDVELLNGAMWLESRTDAALVDGANLAAIGDELVQFGSVTSLGARRFRLSRLLRGRRGTEWAASGHAAGESFVLIERGALVAIDPPVAARGGEARVIALGIGDPMTGVETRRVIEGRAMVPPAPAHLRAERKPGGDIAVSWVRRSRAGWTWSDGVDAPLGEERERYRLRLSGAGFARELELAEQQHLYTVAQQAADGLAGPLTVTAAQLGTAGASRAASITIS